MAPAVEEAVGITSEDNLKWEINVTGTLLCHYLVSL